MGVLNVNLDAPVKSPVSNCMDDSSLDEHLLGVVLVQQYNMRKGLELFGDQSEESTKNELQQINDFDTYIPMDAKSFSREDKMKALLSLMFIVESAMAELRRKHVQLTVSKRLLQVILSCIGFRQRSQLMGSL